MQVQSFNFLVDKFLGGVGSLSFENRGKYITLLCEMAQKGRMKESDIIEIVSEFPNVLKRKFKQDEKGLFYNVRLESEVKKQQSIINRNKKNGSMGGRPKKPNGNPMETQWKPNGNPMGFSKAEISQKTHIADSGKLMDLTQKKINELYNSHSWQNAICMKMGLKIHKLHEFLTDFLNKESLKSDFTVKTMSETRDHFVNWLKVRLEKNKVNGRNEIKQEQRVYTKD